MSIIVNIPTTEVSENTYLNDLRSNPNNMSNWLPAIIPADGEERLLRIPKTLIVQVPDDVCKSFFMDYYNKDRERIIQFVKEQVMPKVKEVGIYPSMFIKNGGFSDKYQFNLCTPGPDEVDMAMNLIKMNYDALCFGADGITEVCIRELIPHNTKTTPCIYHGMPLRPEFRVFYDFDRHQPLYIVNYWDWDYCHDAICRDYTDKIVYEAYYPRLLDQYNEYKDSVIEMVAADMASVSALKGIWSVDVMLCESQERQKEYEGFWLIDMAIGCRSAYWNPEYVQVEET
ncbi:MAG: hypothetical protein HFF08_03985 [Oscillospiraceae bacterium]|nr:hypothetical protein [Oscillospiraceae bacterium]